eukprot:1145349-Pelagomonas_calceolata.AAC.6
MREVHLYLTTCSNIYCAPQKGYYPRTQSSGALTVQAHAFSSALLLIYSKPVHKRKDNARQVRLHALRTGSPN